MSVVDGLGVVGGILGIILASMRVFDWWKESGRLKIELRPKWDFDVVEVKVQKSGLALEIANVGRRPVTLKVINIMTVESGCFSPSLADVESTLTESKHVTIENAARSLDKEIKWIRVYDTVGKTWEPKSKTLRSLNRQIADINAGKPPWKMGNETFRRCLEEHGIRTGIDEETKSE